MDVDSEDSAAAAGSSHQKTVFARLGHAGLSPLVLGEVHPPYAVSAAGTPPSFREQQLYLNSLYSQHQSQVRNL